MNTIFDSASVRKPKTFARGVLRSLPAYRPLASAQDEAAYLAMITASPDYDAMAQKAAARDCLERGRCF